MISPGTNLARLSLIKYRQFFNNEWLFTSALLTANGQAIMKSSQPIVRQVAWLSIIPQLFIIALLAGALFLFGVKEYALVGIFIYFALFLLLRKFVAKYHRKGIAHYKRKDYSKAIPEFENSYAFFSKHPWIDDWRYITLLSSSRISYREMALLNIAFCYGQAGDGNNSKTFYERALKEFPNSEMAKAALRMLASAANIAEQDTAADG